jgi:hypothetical protein
MYKLMLELEPTPEPKNFMKAGTAGQIVTHFPPLPPSPHCTCICTALRETSYVGVLGGGHIFSAKAAVIPEQSFSMHCMYTSQY